MENSGFVRGSVSMKIYRRESCRKTQKEREEEERKQPGRVVIRRRGREMVVGEQLRRSSVSPAASACSSIAKDSGANIER